MSVNSHPSTGGSGLLCCTLDGQGGDIIARIHSGVPACHYVVQYGLGRAKVASVNAINGRIFIGIFTESLSIPVQHVEKQSLNKYKENRGSKVVPHAKVAEQTAWHSESTLPYSSTCLRTFFIFHSR